MSKSQDKKRAAEQFNLRREQAESDRIQAAKDRAAYNATSEGQEKLRVSRKKLITLLAAGVMIGGGL